MFRPYLGYTVRQCFKTHKKNKSGFATKVKLCILSLHYYYFIREAGRLKSSNKQPYKSQEVVKSPGEAKKKEKPRTLSVTYQMYTKAKTLEALHACSGLIYLVPVMHAAD